MDSKVYYKNGEQAYLEKNYREALDNFKKQMDIEASSSCLNYIGCCYLGLEEYFLALQTFNEVIAIEPNWEQPVVNIGRVYLRMQQFKNAFKYLDKGLKMNVQNPDSLFYMGVYYLNSHDYEYAIKYFSQSVQVDEQQSEPHLNLGLCYFRKSLYSLAIQEFEKSYQIAPNADAVRNKGLVFIELKKYSDALEELYLAIKLCPTDIECMVDIIYCNCKLKQFNIALKWAIEALRIDPNHATVKKFYEQINIDLGLCNG
ncbi:TPR repeat-containing protein YrrB [compost metagenome]